MDLIRVFSRGQGFGRQEMEVEQEDRVSVGLRWRLNRKAGFGSAE
jgi:hypothetical protein